MENVKNLESLNMNALYGRGDAVTDAGLENIKDLTALRSLDLSHLTQVTNVGLANLKDLIHLDKLDLRFLCRITRAGLENLKAVKDILLPLQIVLAE